MGFLWVIVLFINCMLIANWVAILRWFPHNIRAIVAKIKLPKKPHSMVIFLIKVRRSYRDLSSQADPARDNWTWSYTYFNNLKRMFRISWKHNSTRMSILTRFDIKFLENGWGFHRRVTRRNELNREVLNSIQKVNVL